MISKMRKGLKNPGIAISYLKNKYSKAVLNLYRNPSIFINSSLKYGKNIFDDSWDVLVILDTCRVDAMQQISSEYEFINDVNSITSVGSHSSEWIANTFVQKYRDTLEATAYISANPHTEMVLLSRFNGELTNDAKRVSRYGRLNLTDASNIGKIENLAPYSGDEYKYCPPRYVTDRGIFHSRNSDLDRIVLHYMPPHRPYLDDAIPEGSELRSYEGGIFDYIAETNDKNSVFEAHKNMIRWVIDEIQLLRKNIDADKIIITSDHGDAFGEYKEYNHRAGSLNPYVKKVPWVTTDATDTGTYEPSFEIDNPDKEQDMKESLKALGYL